MLTLILGTIVTLTLFTIPGYLLSAFSSFCNDSIIERVYFGYILSMAVSILFGLILSYLRSFTPFWILTFVIAYNISSIILYIKFKTNNKRTFTNNYIICQFDRKTGIMISLFILTLLICFIYIQLSPFPLGWDRGKHFGRSVVTLNHHTLETAHPGTNYNPFYFQGLNVIISIFIGTNEFLSNLNPTVIIHHFDSLINLSAMFKFFFALLLSLTVFGIYFVSNHTYKNEKIAILSSTVFISLLGFGIADTPSIGVCIVFLFLSVFFVYVNFLGKSDFNKADWLFISLIITSIIFTHIIGVAFMILFSIITLCCRFTKKEWGTKELQKILALMAISGLFSLLFLSLFYPSLMQGILDEINRKGLTSVSSNETAFMNYSTQNLNILLNMGIVLFVPLVLSVVAVFLEKKRSVAIYLALTSLLFVLFPILPFVKPQWYIIYPISILGGVGLFHIVVRVKTRLKNKNRFWMFIFVYLILGATLSTSNVYALGMDRLRWYNYDRYKEVYDLSVWLNNELDSSHTILFPESGPFAYLLTALSHQKILFAEPRFPDIPSFQETSKVYLKYPTSVGEFNYVNVSSEKRYHILDKYNISVIIETSKIKADIDALKLRYSAAVLFNWYHPTPSYWVIILDSIPPPFDIEETELLESPVDVNLPVGPQWVRIDLAGTTLSNEGVLALRINNHNNASKTFFAQLQDIHGNLTEQILFTLQPEDKSYYIRLTEIQEAVDLSNVAKLALCFSWYGWDPAIDLTINNMTLIMPKS